MLPAASWRPGPVGHKPRAIPAPAEAAAGAGGARPCGAWPFPGCGSHADKGWGMPRDCLIGSIYSSILINRFNYRCGELAGMSTSRCTRKQGGGGGFWGAFPPARPGPAVPVAGGAHTGAGGGWLKMKKERRERCPSCLRYREGHPRSPGERSHLGGEACAGGTVSSEWI